MFDLQVGAIKCIIGALFSNGSGRVRGWGGARVLALIGTAPDSSTILVLNKISSTDGDSFRICMTAGFTSVL